MLEFLRFQFNQFYYLKEFKLIHHVFVPHTLKVSSHIEIKMFEYLFHRVYYISLFLNNFIKFHPNLIKIATKISNNHSKSKLKVVSNEMIKN